MIRNILLLTLITLFALTGTQMSAKETFADPYDNYDESVFMDMELEQNILTPAVGKHEHPAVSKHMKRIGLDLAKKGFTVDMMRDDEVVVVT
ncbi:MAG: hypothetical protein K2K77_08660, partial [Duncaniella sp.]|nr:hypothetical protein [Duncaniella sp.]